MIDSRPPGAVSLAQRAAEQVLGSGARPVRRLAAGRSCQAFLTADGQPVSGEWVVRIPVMPVAAVRRRSLLAAAAQGPIGVVHSDLHREHLLAGTDGGLSGVLDFGDAFVGAVAWDLALLH